MTIQLGNSHNQYFFIFANTIIIVDPVIGTKTLTSYLGGGLRSPNHHPHRFPAKSTAHRPIEPAEPHPLPCRDQLGKHSSETASSPAE
jgi:hypothetical protein